MRAVNGPPESTADLRNNSCALYTRQPAVELGDTEAEGFWPQVQVGSAGLSGPLATEHGGPYVAVVKAGPI